MLAMRILIAVLKALFISLCIAPGTCLSADFTVNPVNIFLDAKQKTAVITITNNGEQPLTLQATAVGWSQDDEGKDVYSSTEDIIMFPRIFTVDKGQQRIVRIGTKVPPLATERTYRIYMEEVPAAQGEDLSGAVLKTLMKVGVPVFISPLKASPEGKIEKANISKGTITFLLVNNGNLHYIMRGVKVEGFDKEGTPVFRKDFGGWYVLSGRSKTFSAEVSREICMKVTTLKIEVSTDIASLKESLSVLPAMCSP
jgi:fimbrial chaperone protein